MDVDVALFLFEDFLPNNCGASNDWVTRFFVFDESARLFSERAGCV